MVIHLISDSWCTISFGIEICSWIIYLKIFLTKPEIDWSSSDFTSDYENVVTVPAIPDTSVLLEKFSNSPHTKVSPKEDFHCFISTVAGHVGTGLLSALGSHSELLGYRNILFF